MQNDDLHETSRLCIKHFALKKQGGKAMEMSFLLEPNQLQSPIANPPPSHDEEEGKLLKFTLQDQGNKPSTDQPPSSIIDIHLVEAVQGPATLVVTSNYCINRPRFSRLGCFTIIHITNSTGYTDLKWQ